MAEAAALLHRRRKGPARDEEEDEEGQGQGPRLGPSDRRSSGGSDEGTSARLRRYTAGLSLSGTSPQDALFQYEPRARFPMSMTEKPVRRYVPHSTVPGSHNGSIFSAACQA